MGEITGISWTDHTWNPWHGCLKVSPGCKFCYMYREKKQYGQDPMSVQRSKTRFTDPLTWKRGRVFTCSWSDFFIAEADDWRPDAWDVIRRTPHLTYQILTKRPERIAAHLPTDWGEGWKHVWLGVSAENQPLFDERVAELQNVPAHLRFVSIEPQLELIDPTYDGPEISFNQFAGFHLTDKPIPRIDWVIVGGESGPGARPFNIEWATVLLAAARHAEIPFFLKQLGAKPHSNGIPIRVTKAGADPKEWPEYLRVQEFPA